MSPSVSRQQRTPRFSRLVLAALGSLAVCQSGISWTAFALHSFSLFRQSTEQSRRGLTARSATFNPSSLNNPVKTVADSVADFYKGYSQPPVLPLFRPMVVDLLSQIHLSLQDQRFVYDSVWALGLREYFMMLMNDYDRLVQVGEAEKIWASLMNAVGLDPVKVTKDAEAAAAYVTSTPTATLLEQVEGKPSDEKLVQALQNIKKSLYSMPFSIGIFRVIELGGVALTRATVEEWMKVVGVEESKATKDLDTYLAFQKKMQASMAMLREVEIRGKKQLAESLEKKAKALQEKANAKLLVEV